ncbi:MAG: phosphatidylserine decarboxylase family protein [Longimicrobiales bacterium]|nr:phosphatidylserine decarboxylase family protein [Longimicrobiales bacterium]
MRFAREGYPFAAGGLLLAGLCWLAVGMRLADPAGWSGRLLLAGAWIFTVLAVFVLWFFRDPAPVAPGEDDVVVAPGQGRVIVVDEADEPTVLGGPARKISIFLSVFDVHVQRAPVSGTVTHRSYRPGTFVAAWADEASEENEQASLGIEARYGPILVRQIAGLVARRIVTDPSEGQRIERGARFGIIRFGSRVDLFLPLHWEVLCAVGDKVRSGSTPVARQRPAPAT